MKPFTSASQCSSTCPTRSKEPNCHHSTCIASALLQHPCCTPICLLQIQEVLSYCHTISSEKKKKVILVIFSLCLSQHFLGIDLKIQQVELGEKLLSSSSEGSAQVQEPIPQMTAQKNIPCFLPWHFNTSSLYFRRRNWHT